MQKIYRSSLRNRIWFSLSCWACLWFALCLHSTAQAQASRRSPADEGWIAAEVVTNQALIHQTPNDASFVTDSVRRGELLWIKNFAELSQWYLVRPPDGAISWILESDISEVRNGEARVRAGHSQIRPGRLGARLPGPPGLDLDQGKIVWLLNREPLVLPQSSRLVTWRAIEPPAEEPRFARKEFLRILSKKEAEPERDGFIQANRPGIMGNAIPEQIAANNENSKTPKTAAKPESVPTLKDDLDLLGPPKASPKDKKATGIESLAILSPPDSLIQPDSPVPDMPNLGNKPSLQFQSPDVPAETTSPDQTTTSPLKLPDDPDQALETLESRFRIIMDQPLIAWDFKPILNACENLRERALSQGQAARLNTIRDKAERQDQIGQSARQFWDSMRRSRAYDPSGIDQNHIMQAAHYNKFDLTGLLLRSKKDVDGHLLFNLIGDSGTTIAYLKMPPAAPVDRWVGKKVGVKGRVRYHEDLRARLVNVQDIELLEPDTDKMQ